MGVIVGALMTLAAAGSAISGSAKASCPAGASTGHYPWLITELMAGDRYADIYLDIDAHGRPLKCRIGRNNFTRDDDRFFVCNAFMEQWRTAPPAGYVKGKPSTEKRVFIEYGIPHQKAERKARKAYFKDHPNERPECYPQH